MNLKDYVPWLLLVIGAVILYLAGYRHIDGEIFNWPLSITAACIIAAGVLLASKRRWGR